MKNNNLFWVSFSDIMLSLFFVMLVLFVVSAALFKTRGDVVKDLEKQIQEIKNIENALRSFDDTYFEFDEENKRYRLVTDVVFVRSSSQMILSDTIENQLLRAGESMYNQIESILSNHDKVNLILIIEGNTQRTCSDWVNLVNCNFIEIPDDGYRLSYIRALVLYNYWKENGIDFRSLTEKYGKRLEVIIAGSGYFGLSRIPDNSPISFKNRRFTIQVTSKYTLVPKTLNTADR
jgi:outer membrane protein OmpA-like peptidoglycan-associated protein